MAALLLRCPLFSFVVVFNDVLQCNYAHNFEVELCIAACSSSVDFCIVTLLSCTCTVYDWGELAGGVHLIMVECCILVSNLLASGYGVFSRSYICTCVLNVAIFLYYLPCNLLSPLYLYDWCNHTHTCILCYHSGMKSELHAMVVASWLLKLLVQYIYISFASL